MRTTDLRAPLGIRKILMIPHQMLLVPRIQLHPLIILDAPEHHLAEAVEVRHVGELRVVELRHERSRRTRVVDLMMLFLSMIVRAP